MSNDRMTVVPDFLGELDADVFMNKIAAALNTTALGVLNNGNKGKVVLTFDFERMGNSVEEKRVKIKHKLNYSTPTPRGKHHPAGRSGPAVRDHWRGGWKA